MKVKSLTGSLGAEISAIGLGNLTSTEFDAIEQAFTDYLVLCFRDQCFKDQCFKDQAPGERQTGTVHQPHLSSSGLRT